MSEKRWMLLKAIKENWGLTGPGDWSEVRWVIFDDGSYEVVSTSNPTSEAWDKAYKMGEYPKPGKKQTTGKMDGESFSKLLEAMRSEPWRDPTVNVDACDGVAWEIESYGEDGSVKNTSGKLGYIYGHRSLEKIASLLPEDENVYDSAAFISVKKID